MKYSDAVNFLLSRTDYERWPGYQYASRFDLRRMDDLLQRLGNPHLKANTVHIAGSKGKGSTAAMIASGLRAAGYKTGLYTSPHLVTLRERINVNGKSILKRDLIRTVQEIRPSVEAVDQECKYGELSTFELLTAAAFAYFQHESVDFRVLETGLGGRLDATNVASPNVCVITSISLDHTEVLGDTLAKIAREKAGIIKQGIPVISSQQDKKAFAVIRDECLQKGSPLVSIGNEITYKKLGVDLSGQTVVVNGVKDSYHFIIPLLGAHQLQNAATAVAALETLGLSKVNIESGLAKTNWPGRLQILKRRPLIVTDGAHTVDSAKRLKEALKQHFHFANLVLIIGASSDKDLSGVIAELAPEASSVIATKSRHPRATEPQVVADEFARLGVKAAIADNASMATEKAQQLAGKKDLICATGSLFLVGEMIELVKGLRPEPYPV